MSVGEAGGAAFVQEVDVLDEEAEEWNHDLQGRRRDGGREREEERCSQNCTNRDGEVVKTRQQGDPDNIKELNSTNDQHLLQLRLASLSVSLHLAGKAIKHYWSFWPGGITQ